MIRVYPAASRHSFDHGWLRGSFSFSFGDYYDPDNTAFGPMRVGNDDTIAPGRGFGAHPHSDMEIVSIVLKGQLRHEDSLGNVAVTSYGEVQRMSAGTGVIHTEHNPSATEEVNLLQLWFMPERKGLSPSYETTRFDAESLYGQLVPVASHDNSEHVAKLHQDMTIYLGKMKPGGGSIRFTQPSGRRVYVFAIEGSVQINGSTTLERRDAARMTDEPELQLQHGRGSGESFLMLIDMP